MLLVEFMLQMLGAGGGICAAHICTYFAHILDFSRFAHICAYFAHIFQIFGGWANFFLIRGGKKNLAPKAPRKNFWAPGRVQGLDKFWSPEPRFWSKIPKFATFFEIFDDFSDFLIKVAVLLHPSTYFQQFWVYFCGNMSTLMYFGSLKMAKSETPFSHICAYFAHILRIFCAYFGWPASAYFHPCIT